MKWHMDFGKKGPRSSDFEGTDVKLAEQELDNIRDELMRHKEVFAVDIGYKIKRQQASDPPQDLLGEDIREGEQVARQQLALRVHLYPKLGTDKLEEKGKTDFGATYGSRVSQVVLSDGSNLQFDVVEAQYGPSNRSLDLIDIKDVGPRDRVDPVVGGVTVGSERGRGGTLGAVVWDETDYSVCILSNWHTIAGVEARKGDSCVQPSVFDGGLKGPDTVANLKRWRIDETVDAALAQLRGDRLCAIGEILIDKEIVRIQGLREKAATLGTEVWKGGRTTGKTSGIIDGVHMSLSVDFDGGRYCQTLRDQLHIVAHPLRKGAANEVSQAGDSGSIWLDRSFKAVGLHFAGDIMNSPIGDFAVANRMEEVHKKLEFSFTTPYFRRPSAALPASVPLRAAPEVGGAAGVPSGNGGGGEQPVPIFVGGQPVPIFVRGQDWAEFEAWQRLRSGAAGGQPVPIFVGGS